MGQATVFALRAVIVALLAGSVVVQAVMVPLLASDLEGLDAEYSYLRSPFLTIVVLIVLAAQTVLVCVWRLVTMARRGTVFSHAAFRYVHIVIGAFVAAAVLVFALGALLAPGRPSHPASCSWWAGSAWRSGDRARRPRAADAAGPGRGAEAGGHAHAGRAGRGDLMPIAVDIDVMLARRKMSVGNSPSGWGSPRRTWPS